MRALLIAALLLCTSWVGATEVEAVQAPAWLVRDAVRKPLAPGMALLPRDKVVTGPGARVYLMLPEGSRVKLGAGAEFVIAASNEADGSATPFRAALEVLKGAFRFTTDALNKVGKREVNIRVATVTAGIRGTDVWGKSAPDKDFVCLLEGRIAVAADGHPEQAMTEAGTFYQVPKGQAPLPVGPIPEGKLAEWAAETEIDQGAGATRGDGGWRLVAASAPRQADALRVYDALQGAGYAAKLRRYGKGPYLAVIDGYASVADARVDAARVAALLGTAEGEVVQFVREKGR
ncbi:FecR family protein [Chitinolyticbacter meiyuanensis]|uniref:FecR family protein n=1 Tax=Chitinolyticbacter meiyuanensis TaxID=682798 RepID=UPI0011E6041E|nr:FecR family protein [Chitinolyticbacter meiyuanensis]